MVANKLDNITTKAHLFTCSSQNVTICYNLSLYCFKQKKKGGWGGWVGCGVWGREAYTFNRKVYLCS